MPRHNSAANELLNGHCTIRKRVCSSPSSSSSVLKNHCFKRTILVAKRRGSTTPVPLWRMNARSPRSSADFSETSQHPPSQDGAKETQAIVSARKLGNALWELNKTPSPEVAKILQDRRLTTKIRQRDRTSGSVGAGSLRHQLYKSAHSPISELYNRSRSSSHKRMLPLIPQKFPCKENDHVSPDLLSKANLMETEASFQGLAPRSSLVGSKNCLKDLRNGLMTSKELVKILTRFCGLGKQQTSAISLATALYCQLDRALVQVDQLIQERKSDKCLMRPFMEEKEASKSEKQEGIRVAVQSVIEELETEKNLRKIAERMNEKLRMELAQMKTSLVNSGKELESERRTREMIEQVCGEMIRGFGEDKAEVEELKRESVKVREELEHERQMLQLADEWREERVQMKLSEAKYQFEEKNAAVDQLRYELEAFLAAKRTEDLVNGQWDVADNLDSDCERQMVHPSRSSRATNLTMNRRDAGGEGDQEENDGTDSEDSDLHSIELNMNNNNNSYIWGYAAAATEDEGKLSLAKEKPERSTKCEKLSGSDLSSGRVMTEGIKEKFTRNFRHLDDNLDEGRPIDNSGRLDQSGERYISVEGVGDHKLAGSSIVVPCGLPSSTRQWSRQEALQNKGEQVCVESKVAEMVKAIRESESKASLVRNKVHSQLQIAPIQ